MHDKKTGTGRPPLPSAELRSSRVVVTLTAEQRDRLIEGALLNGQPLSSYVLCVLQSAGVV